VDVFWDTVYNHDDALQSVKVMYKILFCNIIFYITLTDWDASSWLLASTVKVTMPKYTSTTI